MHALEDQQVANDVSYISNDFRKNFSQELMPPYNKSQLLMHNGCIQRLDNGSTLEQ